MQSAAVKKWKAQLRADLKTAERAHRRLPENIENSAFSETLACTYFRIEKEGRSAIAAMRYAAPLPVGEQGLPRAYDALYALCKEGTLPDFPTLCGFCRENRFTIAELTMTQLLLKSVFLSLAAKAVKQQDAALLGCAARALAQLPDLPLRELFSVCSETEAMLCRDRGFFIADESTRALYRSRLCAYAAKMKLSETDALDRLLAAAKREHTTLYRLLLPSHETRGKALLLSEALLPLAVSAVMAVFLRRILLIPLLWLPLWAVLRGILERIFSAGIPPCVLPAAELRGKIPASARTVITISSLLPAPDSIPKLQSHLLDVYLRAGEGAVSVCLLADLKGADSVVRPEDRAKLSAAKAMIDALNKEYPNAFSLFVRARTWSPTQRQFTGKDRKRGAINDFVRYLRTGDRTPFCTCHGAVALLQGAKYLFALDSDTCLTLDCLYALVCVAEHPENEPVTDAVHGRVTNGYGIFAPRVENTIESVYKTHFSKTMAGAGGVSGYDMHTSERWQDLFGAGLFTGKGLIRIDVYAALLPDAFPAETILSHDIPEGELLRTAFVSDVQVSDGVPSNAQSFFARMGRWVRGDAQNTALLFKTVQTAKGRRENPFSAVSKYKLFDNLRRAVTPFFSLLLCLLSVLFSAKTAAVLLGVGVLSCCADSLWSLLSVLFHGGVRALCARFYGKTVPDAVRHAADGLLSILLLPVTAVTCTRGFVLGLVRRFVTKRNMLEWVTAADSERAGTPGGRILSALPALLCAGWLLWLGSPAARLVALLFLAEPIFSAVSARPYPEKRGEIHGLPREKLISYAASMWKYYAENCNAQNHHLPPDNIQTSPVARVAHRTSPTNIGLALCACLAACDLYLISPEEMCARLCCTLDTVAKLPHWHGNLLNWYDTEDLTPLAPRYVSAVDSGNFLCCLAALREGVAEYLPACPALQTVLNKIDEELKNAELSALYDRRRDLFFIGFDLDSQTFTNAHYDLLMSESRMMSYYACAARQVPKSHWGALGRVLSKSDGYTGALSWSGTMFEYFMPYLFLESRENTLAYEALRYCVHCQRMFAHRHNVPFGVSESGYYRFDAEGNYQYRAHGVPKLALRQSVWDETVVSPYSTFLVLPFLPKTALRNLESLERLHAVGEYGFFEALDFTKGGAPRMVRSFMAHHLGMSLLSVDNALLGGIMQKRFLRNSQMRAGASLLEERVPTDPLIFHRKTHETAPERPEREKPRVAEGYEPKLSAPQVQLYSNGAWTTVLSDCGTSHSLYGGVHLTRESRDVTAYPLGVFSVLRVGKARLVGCRALEKSGGTKFSCTFSDAFARLTAENGSFMTTQEIAVHPSLPAELRRFTVTNKTDKNVHAVLTVYLEPSLTEKRAETAHKTFQKLFVTASYESAGALAVFERRTKAGETPLFLGCGLSDETGYTCVLQRERALSRLSGVFSLGEKGFAKGDETAVADTCFLAEIPLDLPRRAERQVTVQLCCARDRETLETRMAALRKGSAGKTLAGAPRLFSDISVPTKEVLPSLFGCAALSAERQNALAANNSPRSFLWRFGISGDRPVWLLRESVCMDFDTLLPYLRFFLQLRAAGVACDLVLCVPGGEEKLLGLRQNAETHLQKESRPQSASQAGSVFYLSADTLTAEEKNALYAFSEALTPCDIPVSSEEAVPVPVSGTKAIQNGENRPDEAGYTIQSKPRLPWVYALSNPSFSTLVGDRTLGTSFAVNSRLNKLTAFRNDTTYDNDGERLFLWWEGKIYDVLQNAAVRFGEERAEYTADVENLHITATVTVPEKGMRKEIAVELQHFENTEKTAKLCYYTVPALCEDGTPAPYLQSRFSGGGVEIRNPCNTAVPGVMRVETDTKDAVFYTTSRADFFGGRWESGRMLPNSAPCAAVGRTLHLPPRRKEKVRFILSFGHTEKSVRTLGALSLSPKTAPAENRIEIHTPDDALNTLFNGFLPNQIINGRLFARSGFYQSGGAYGFRDQLQDTTALITVAPKYARRQIFRCCAAQFEEGDVLHWWHPTLHGDGKWGGVRTRYSDDLLWLPFVLSKYVLRTGDAEILRVPISYLSAQELADNEHERYFDVPRGENSGSVEAHAVRAINRAMRFGAHGLLLMGSGDWNDSFNHVGAKGKGESVWLSQFAVMVLEGFGEMLRTVGKEADSYFDTAKQLRAAIEAHAWDGDRYLRAYYDDGAKMGSAESAECRIDSLTQSFAVFAKLTPERRKTALQTAYRELVDAEHGVVRLFAPAFSGENKKAGYVAAYPAGIRENGGQYTHAAVWFCRALFQNGLHEEGETVLHLLNPLEKYKDRALCDRYKTEPYYLAGDVYAAEGAKGRGGWSLYTGSAGHFYALVAEELLGVREHGGAFTFKPNPPKSWGDFRFTLHLSGAEIKVEAPRTRAGGMLVDGKPAQSLRPDGKNHTVKLL